MTKYILAIDETGSFALGKNDKSFVCGVLVKENEYKLKQAYQQVYKEFGFSEPIPTTTKELLTMSTVNENEDNARFHFNKLTDEQKEICRKHLLPFVGKVYISTDKPALYANNQDWWLRAITLVVREFLRDLRLEKDDEVEAWIDNRNQKVWGVVDDGNNMDTEDDNKFMNYHNIIKQQIKDSVNTYVPYKEKLRIYFNSDTSSFFINLADIVCGFVRKERSVITTVIEECSCRKFSDGSDPVALKDKNPLAALNIIYQEVDENKLDNIGYVAEILGKLRKDIDDYEMAWDMFYDFLKSQIETRKSDSALVSKKNFVDIFLSEFNNYGKNQISASRCLENMVLFVEYFSHIGDTKTPINRDEFVDKLKVCDRNTETRTLRKWEKLISYTLHETQLLFNNYNFSEAKENLEKIWEKHEGIISLLKDVLYEEDEPTAALIGSLAQSYSFEDNEEAEEYFNLSKKYAIKSTARTDSYLFNIYHKQKNTEKCRECFEQCCTKISDNKITPEKYYTEKKYNNNWDLLLYCKLRALELYVSGTTKLPAIDLITLKNYNTEYPFPLIMKWEGIALWLENKDANRSKVEQYFTDAINNLLNKNNGFAIRTLALPIIQCYALVNNQNPFHAKYNNYLSELKEQSEYFKVFADSSAILGNIKNDKDIWERAMSLPFYYS